ncbi:MAG: diol dehydratase small subunit [Clostridia bacterium]|nr:diol dehydratase small subunit [Clostridia bacterium]
MKKRNCSKDDYPLYEKRPDLIYTPTGKGINEINMDRVLSDKITPDDCKISAGTLEYQAQIAESMGNWQIADNFRRAAELTNIPDKRILEIYNLMRPFRSTKKELLDIAEELEKKYGATRNANFIREAAEIYEKRELIKKIGE